MISADFTPLTGLTGGLLIGTAAVLLMLANGRIAGISGMLSGALFQAGRAERGWRIAFIIGLLAGAMLFRVLSGGFPFEVAAGWPSIVLGGLLVGYGTRLGSGCTSGHGVCGISRGSARSVAATVTFIASGMFTVFLMSHLASWGSA